MDRRPAFTGRLVAIWIVGRGVEDRDADVAGRIDCVKQQGLARASLDKEYIILFG